MIKVHNTHVWLQNGRERGMDRNITAGRNLHFSGIQERNCKCGSYSVNPLSSSLTGWDKEIDIQRTIKLVRTQRPGMVQTEVRVEDDERVK